MRERLPSERRAINHRFDIGGHKGYLIVGLYGDGRPGEVFIRMAKMGSTVNGLMDSFAIAVSMGLQHGVPLEKLVEKFINVRFEPMGKTQNPQVPEVESIVDYIAKWMKLKFLSIEEGGAS